MPESKYADLTGVRLHYLDWGGEGVPLLLLHGLASNARIWDLTAPLLTPHFRVVALDQRGHGQSDKPDGDYSFAEVTGDLAELLPALGLDRPVIVGHSWGGNVALQFAADHPGSVRALVLVDGGFLEISSLDGMTWERAEQMMAPPKLDGMPLEAFLAAARSWPQIGAIWNDEIRDIVLGSFDVTREGTINPRLARANHMRILRAMWDHRPSLLWERVRCPVLLLPAVLEDEDEDGIWLEGKRRTIAGATHNLADCHLHWMNDTIHDVPLQRPGELADEIIGFARALA
jgi:pimeloyl-ACP methyl ester carboxylesterase